MHMWIQVFDGVMSFQQIDMMCYQRMWIDGCDGVTSFQQIVAFELHLTDYG